MRHARGQDPVQAVGGGDSLYKYALPIRSDRLLYRLITSSFGRQVGILRDFPPNALIFRADEQPAEAWIVSGSARLFFPSSLLARSTSRPTIPGELIGLSETLAEISYQATLRTVSRCDCLMIARNELIEILRQDVMLRESLLRDLAQRVTTAYGALRNAAL